jgi:MFS family permease
MSHSYSPEIIAAEYPSRRLHALMRSSVIGLTAFLTVVDLFAIQAILPTLAQHYKVTAAAMGFAVNASTMGMAIGALLVGVASEKIDRRMGILISLALLSLPTALLARLIRIAHPCRSPAPPIWPCSRSCASCKAFACLLPSR